MEKYWIPLRSVPPGGKTLIFDDQELWLAPIREFGLDCRIAEPLAAKVAILPQDQGVLFRGRIRGTVALPCDRCANDSLVRLDHGFDSFEPLPAETPTPRDKGRKHGAARDFLQDVREEDDQAADVDEAVVRLAAHGRGVEINPAALLWQEFSLALPVKPVCGEDCKGLCPVCGSNLNTAPCSCAAPQGDPRLAALRGLTVNRKNK